MMAGQSDNKFDFSKLCENFAKLCPDFCRTQTEKQESLDFANKVLFNLCPKMRAIKKSGTSGEMWRLMFAGGGSVFIYSYSFKKPMNVNPHLLDKKLYLTLKQASLLAVSKLCSTLPDNHSPGEKILLTPLARAVFAPQNILKIAAELTVLFGSEVKSGKVVKAVISSCQSDGFYLQHSECHIALVALEVTVVNAANRQKLRSKAQRLYAKHGKNFSNDQYKIYLKYSKVANRLPDAAVEPEASTSTQASQTQVPVKSIESVLRSIARSVDDPISGSTLELNFISPPAAESKPGEPDELPTPIDFRIAATDLELIKSVHLPSTPRREPITKSNEQWLEDYEYYERMDSLNFNDFSHDTIDEDWLKVDEFYERMDNINFDDFLHDSIDDIDYI